MIYSERRANSGTAGRLIYSPCVPESGGRGGGGIGVQTLIVSDSVSALILKDENPSQDMSTKELCVCVCVCV